MIKHENANENCHLNKKHLFVTNAQVRSHNLVIFNNSNTSVSITGAVSHLKASLPFVHRNQNMT